MPHAREASFRASFRSNNTDKLMGKNHSLLAKKTTFNLEYEISSKRNQNPKIAWAHHLELHKLVVKGNMENNLLYSYFVLVNPYIAIIIVFWLITDYPL